MKTLYVLIVAGLWMLPLPSPGGAAVRAGGSGVDLLADCRAATAMFAGQPVTPEQTVSASLCTGFVSGMLDMHTIAIRVQDMTPLFCAPVTLDMHEAVRVVVRYLQAHPNDLPRDGAALTIAALQDAFPCQER